MEMDRPALGAEDSVLKRACDQCRIRKVKCDKESPCSNCRTSQRTCSSTGAGQRPKEQKQRVLISEQYERKIDIIDERLANIEELLRGLAPHVSIGQDGRSSSRPSFAATPSASAGDRDGDESSVFGHGDAGSESAFMGDSSLAAHTVFASEFIEVAVRGSRFRDDLSPNMFAALASLRQIVALQKRQVASHETFTFPRQRSVPSGGLSQLPMPPVAVVVATLKRLKTSPPSFLFRYISSLLGPEDFGEFCRKVYFCTEEYSCSTFIIVNAGLYYIFMEQSYFEADPAIRDEVRGYCGMCQANLETALANLPLLLPAKCESIEALLMGALYATDVSKPSLGWQLTSKAAELCQTLGYHRATPEGQAPEKDEALRQLLFWHTYMLDSSFALRLGRPSTIQEWDITIDRSVNLDGVPEPWGPIVRLWVRHAGIQNRIYKLLYSPAALSRPVADQELCARGLAKELADLTLESLSVRNKAVADMTASSIAGIGDIHLRGDEVTFYSTLTLAYRAIPTPKGSPSRFCSECIEAARHTMRVHQQCMDLIGPGEYLKVVYVHWAILLTPFVPFFVLLCHVIDTSELSDLERLDDFVESLLPVCPLSEPVEKLHRLCHVMCSIARLYVEAKAQQHANESFGPIGDEFEMYLGALGFMPAEGQQDPALVDVDLNNRPFQQSSQLVDWFSGNRNMMGLLEDDLPDFKEAEWGGAGT